MVEVFQKSLGASKPSPRPWADDPSLFIKKKTFLYSWRPAIGQNVGKHQRSGSPDFTMGTGTPEKWCFNSPVAKSSQIGSSPQSRPIKEKNKHTSVRAAKNFCPTNSCPKKCTWENLDMYFKTDDLGCPGIQEQNHLWEVQYLLYPLKSVKALWWVYLSKEV